MATLCTLLIACNKEEIAADINYSEKIETRSADNLSVRYTTAGGQDTTVSCTKLLIDYNEGSTAELLFEFSNNTSVDADGDNIEVLNTSNKGLLVTPTEGTQFSIDDITVTVCGEELCYSDTKQSVTGTATGFIVEDNPEGI